MKNWFWIPMAAIVGVIAGSWGPREDLEKFKANVHEERTRKKVSGAAGFDAFAHLVSIPDVAKRRPKARTNAVEKGESVEKVEKGERVEKVEGGGVETNGVGRRARSQLSREDLAARIEEAAELWNARVELAKTQWKGKLGVGNGAESASFDSAVATMNESLRDTMEAFAEEVEKAGKMTPELGLRMMGDLTRTLAETYDAIGAAVPQERRDEVSEIPVHEFIDPMVAEPLIGVQDKLEGGFMAHGGRR